MSDINKIRGAVYERDKYTAGWAAQCSVTVPYVQHHDCDNPKTTRRIPDPQHHERPSGRYGYGAGMYPFTKPDGRGFGNGHGDQEINPRYDNQYGGSGAGWGYAGTGDGHGWPGGWAEHDDDGYGDICMLVEADFNRGSGSGYSRGSPDAWPETGAWFRWHH